MNRDESIFESNDHERDDKVTTKSTTTASATETEQSFVENTGSNESVLETSQWKARNPAPTTSTTTSRTTTINTKQQRPLQPHYNLSPEPSTNYARKSKCTSQAARNSTLPYSRNVAEVRNKNKGRRRRRRRDKESKTKPNTNVHNNYFTLYHNNIRGVQSKAKSLEAISKSGIKMYYLEKLERNMISQIL